MKAIIIFSVILVLTLSSSLKNTTAFFNKELNTSMSGQSYSGY